MVESHQGPHPIPGYEIVRKLGSGATSSVFLAKQQSLARMVAIKVLRRQYSSDREFVDRFYTEGQVAARLSHPNIVGVLDVGTAGDFHYLVMEYINGGSVADYLAQHARYPEHHALPIIIHIARALEFAHQSGFVHLDVKPKNIMLTPEGVAKLADLGLARTLADLQVAKHEQGTILGTPDYISPEQIRSLADLDFRADIYSLGVTLYHMITGQAPFHGPSPSVVMQKHLRSTLIPPDHILPELSTGVGEVIEVCMAKDRDQRYQSTTALLDDLEAVARHEPPMQARKTFDLAFLAELEPPSPTDPNHRSNPLPQLPHYRTPLTEHPLFWVAVAGWTLAISLLVCLLAVLIR